MTGFAPVLRACGLERDEDRVAHDLEPLAFAEHVLGPAEADALRAVAPGLRGLLGLVRVGPDLEPADFVGPAEDLLELGLVLEPGRDGRDRAQIDLAGRAVDADRIALGERLAARSRGLRGVIDDQLVAAGDARLADLARDDGGVGRGAAAGGENPLRD